MYFRGYKRTIRQKLDEAIIALWIETRFSKEEILRKYLDNIYFGNRIYGLQGAIDVYFP
jgi:penicillin-binding protein 1A